MPFIILYVFFKTFSFCSICILLFSSTTYTQWGQTAVYHASAEGHSEVVKLLIQAGADLEIQHKVHIILWERFMLAHAMCDIAAWDEAMTTINVLIMKVPAGT